MTTAEKILTSLNEQLKRAVEEEMQAKDAFDAADKAWEAALERKVACKPDEYDELNRVAAFLEGTTIARQQWYEYRQGARHALEHAVEIAKRLEDVAKRLEDADFLSEAMA